MYRTIFRFVLGSLGIILVALSVLLVLVNTHSIKQAYYRSAIHQILYPVDKRQRIAVVGGGISGLTAAYRLQQKGYKNVTVFEKNAEVGGKISTFYYQGVAYEKGAVGLNGFFEIAGLAKELGIEPDLTPPVGIYYLGKYISTSEFVTSIFGVGPTLKSMLSLVLLRLRFPEIAETSLHDVDPELMVPLNRFLVNHPEISFAVNVPRPLIVGQGYGYYEEVPAIYILRLVYNGTINNLKVLSGLSTIEESGIYYFKSGYQKVLIKMAESLRVKTDARVTGIDRTSSESVMITYVHKGKIETAAFDVLIIATPLDSANEFVDDLAGEHALFQQIRNYRYYSIIFRANNLPRSYGAFWEEKANIAARGDLLGWANPNEKDVYMGYLHAMPNASESEVVGRFSAGIAEIGGDYIETLDVNEWKYFPTVTVENMQAGFFDQVNALQGRNHTYYIGSSLSVERVDFAIRQTEEIINRYF